MNEPPRRKRTGYQLNFILFSPQGAGELYPIEIKHSIRQFLKPNSKKMIVLLLILLLFVNGFLGLISLPPQYTLLNKYIFANSGGVNLAQYPTAFLFFVFFGFRPDNPEISFLAVAIAFILSVLIGLFFWYIIVCLIFSVNDYFKRFGKKAGKYKVGMAAFIVLIYAGYAIITQKAQDSVSVGAWVPSQITAQEAYSCHHSLLQVMTIENSFPISINYQLSDVHMCLYDVQSGSMERMPSDYRIEGNEVATSNRISLAPFSKTEVHLNGTGYICGYDKDDISEHANEYIQYDEILFLREEGVRAPCINWSEKKIRNAERIKIIK